MFLAVDGGEPVGGATVAVGEPQHVQTQGENEAVLWDIRVNPERRREGLGTRLFSLAVEWACMSSRQSMYSR